jgi:hypothetical protein
MPEYRAVPGLRDHRETRSLQISEVTLHGAFTDGKFGLKLRKSASGATSQQLHEAPLTSELVSTRHKL